MGHYYMRCVKLVTILCAALVVAGGLNLWSPGAAYAQTFCFPPLCRAPGKLECSRSGGCSNGCGYVCRSVTALPQGTPTQLPIPSAAGESVPILPLVELKGSPVSVELAQVAAKLEPGEKLEPELLTEGLKSYASELADFYTTVTSLCHVSSMSTDMAIAERCPRGTKSQVPLVVPEARLRQWRSVMTHFGSKVLTTQAQLNLIGNMSALSKGIVGPLYLLSEGTSLTPFGLAEFSAVMRGDAKLAKSLSIKLEGCKVPLNAEGRELSTLCRTALPLPPVSVTLNDKTLRLARDTKHETNVVVRISKVTGDGKKRTPIALLPVRIDGLAAGDNTEGTVRDSPVKPTPAPGGASATVMPTPMSTPAVSAPVKGPIDNAPSNRPSEPKVPETRPEVLQPTSTVTPVATVTVLPTLPVYSHALTCSSEMACAADTNRPECSGETVDVCRSLRDLYAAYPSFSLLLDETFGEFTTEPGPSASDPKVGTNSESSAQTFTHLGTYVRQVCYSQATSVASTNIRFVLPKGTGTVSVTTNSPLTRLTQNEICAGMGRKTRVFRFPGTWNNARIVSPGTSQQVSRDRAGRVSPLRLASSEPRGDRCARPSSTNPVSRQTDSDKVGALPTTLFKVPADATEEKGALRSQGTEYPQLLRKASSPIVATTQVSNPTCKSAEIEGLPFVSAVPASSLPSGASAWDSSQLPEIMIDPVIIASFDEDDVHDFAILAAGHDARESLLQQLQSAGYPVYGFSESSNSVSNIMNSLRASGGGAPDSVSASDRRKHVRLPKIPAGAFLLYKTPDGKESSVRLNTPFLDAILTESPDTNCRPVENPCPPQSSPGGDSTITVFKYTCDRVKGLKYEPITIPLYGFVAPDPVLSPEGLKRNLDRKDYDNWTKLEEHNQLQKECEGHLFQLCKDGKVVVDDNDGNARWFVIPREKAAVEAEANRALEKALDECGRWQALKFSCLGVCPFCTVTSIEGDRFKTEVEARRSGEVSYLKAAQQCASSGLTSSEPSQSSSSDSTSSSDSSAESSQSYSSDGSYSSLPTSADEDSSRTSSPSSEDLSTSSNPDSSSISESTVSDSSGTNSSDSSGGWESTIFWCVGNCPSCAIHESPGPRFTSKADAGSASRRSYEEASRRCSAQGDSGPASAGTAGPGGPASPPVNPNGSAGPTTQPPSAIPSQKVWVPDGTTRPDGNPGGKEIPVDDLPTVEDPGATGEIRLVVPGSKEELILKRSKFGEGRTGKQLWWLTRSGSSEKIGFAQLQRGSDGKLRLHRLGFFKYSNELDTEKLGPKEIEVLSTDSKYETISIYGTEITNPGDLNTALVQALDMAIQRGWSPDEATRTLLDAFKEHYIATLAGAIVGTTNLKDAVVNLGLSIAQLIDLIRNKQIEVPVGTPGSTVGSDGKAYIGMRDAVMSALGEKFREIFEKALRDAGVDPDKVTDDTYADRPEIRAKLFVAGLILQKEVVAQLGTKVWTDVTTAISEASKDGYKFSELMANVSVFVASTVVGGEITSALGKGAGVLGEGVVAITSSLVTKVGPAAAARIASALKLIIKATDLSAKFVTETLIVQGASVQDLRAMIGVVKSTIAALKREIAKVSSEKVAKEVLDELKHLEDVERALEGVDEARLGTGKGGGEISRQPAEIAKSLAERVNVLSGEVVMSRTGYRLISPEVSQPAHAFLAELRASVESGEFTNLLDRITDLMATDAKTMTSFDRLIRELAPDGSIDIHSISEALRLGKLNGDKAVAIYDALKSVAKRQDQTGREAADILDELSRRGSGFEGLTRSSIEIMAEGWAKRLSESTLPADVALRSFLEANPEVKVFFVEGVTNGGSSAAIRGGGYGVIISSDVKGLGARDIDELIRHEMDHVRRTTLPDRTNPIFIDPGASDEMHILSEFEADLQGTGDLDVVKAFGRTRESYAEKLERVLARHPEWNGEPVQVLKGLREMHAAGHQVEKEIFSL